LDIESPLKGLCHETEFWNFRNFAPLKISNFRNFDP
jgi:hypothetical protein